MKYPLNDYTPDFFAAKAKKMI
jgi:hypothetical protein